MKVAKKWIVRCEKHNIVKEVDDDDIGFRVDVNRGGTVSISMTSYVCPKCAEELGISLNSIATEQYEFLKGMIARALFIPKDLLEGSSGEEKE